MFTFPASKLKIIVLRSKKYGWTIAKRSQDDPYEWHLLMKGPRRTIYNNLSFLIFVRFYDGMCPPHFPLVRFMTKISHPNVTNRGFLIQYAKSRRVPKPFNIIRIIRMIKRTLVKPNIDFVVDEEALKTYFWVRAKYSKKKESYFDKLRSYLDQSSDDEL